MEKSPDLSKREREVVEQLLEGKSNKQIAHSMHISERTVEFHLKNIYEKYHVSSRLELILKLGETGVSFMGGAAELRESTGADQSKTPDLGDSTVAGEGEILENTGRSNSPDWTTPLRNAASEIGKEIEMEGLLNPSSPSVGSSPSFFESIRICFVKFADFTGQASRPEFWWFTLFVVLASAALAYLSEPMAAAFLTVMLLPFLAAGTRRLHDTGRSGWWQLFLLVPIGGIVVVGSLWAVPSAAEFPEGENQA
jgi:DNA-binding CsgD family transcriptional regulator